MANEIILGGGIAGVAAAQHALQNGSKPVVFEALDRAGGLLDNFTVDGYRFDNAVHLSFATEPEVRSVFDRTPYLTHPAHSVCWDNGSWLKHPAQNNMYPLSVEEKVNLISGLNETRSEDIQNYEDWLCYQYGRPIAERWPIRYTLKYWSIPANRMGVRWIGQRMRQADIREVLQGALSPQTPNTYYVKEMRYPKRGGYRAFIEGMIDTADVRCGYKAISVNRKERVVTFSNGETVEYQGLISTIPLPLLINIIDDVPKDVREAADTLFATEIDLISVGFNHPEKSPSLWFYIYDDDILAARAYSPGLKSPDNVPEGKSSLQFEIYSSRERPHGLTPEALKANTMLALERFGVAGKSDIVFMHHKKLKYGNVVFDLGMESRRDLVRAWLDDVGIITAGRFGEWDYLWSNQAMISGIQAAQRLYER